MATAAGLSAAASAAQLDPQQMALIKDAATSICNTVKDIKGEKTYAQIQGEVKGQLSGLLGRLSGTEASASGTGTLARDAFEGLTQDATATALTDRDCRMKLFNKMFDTITAPAGAAVTTSVPARADCGLFGCIVNDIVPGAGDALDSANKRLPASIVGNGYQFLYSKGAERGGFGLYTYVLLTSSNSERVKAMLEAVLNYTRQASALVALGGDPTRINVIYIPLTPGRDPGPNPGVTEIAARYNFDLSQALIEKICEMSTPEVLEICKTGLGSGPYLFSYARPIGNVGKLTPPILFVDLTRIQLGAFANSRRCLQGADQERRHQRRGEDQFAVHQGAQHH